jgi:predicted nucleotidyltransferase
VLADASAEDGATWDSLCADDDVRIEKLRIIRDGELAHRLLVMGRRGDTVRLNVDELEQLVESAKRRLKFLEKLVGLPVVPFFKREAVFKSVDSVFQSLIERVGRRADEWARLPEHYLFVRKLRAHESVKQLIVFGSFARGEQRQGSDIDLAITCVPNTPSQRAQIEAIVEDADTLRRIDLVWLDSLPEASSLHAAIKRDGRALKGEVPT